MSYAAGLRFLGPTARAFLISAVLAVLLMLTSAHALGNFAPLKLSDDRLLDTTRYWWQFSVPLLAALFLRLHWPLVALALAVIGAVGHQYFGVLNVLPIDLVVPIALYSVAARMRRRWITVAVTATLLAGALAIEVMMTTKSPFSILDADRKYRLPLRPDTIVDAVNASGDRAMGTLLILAFAAAVGQAASVHRAYRDMVEQRTADLERERRQQVALATAAERARISRELHDVVAHSLTVMVANAQAALAARARRPEQSAEAMAEVVTTGRGALTEMRRLLGTVARDPDDTAPPGLHGLADLLDRVRAAGTPVALRVDGQPLPLPAQLDLTAYRIVQEALTNTLKHAAAGASAQVRLAFEEDYLDIEVTDDGAGVSAAAAGGPGNGLRGIAERVAQHGGVASAGPRDGGGFAVTARLPLAAPDPLALAGTPAPLRNPASFETLSAPVTG
jgi:signal transduction histidine kinase